MKIVDANIILRYLLDDIDELAEKASLSQVSFSFYLLKGFCTFTLPNTDLNLNPHYIREIAARARILAELVYKKDVVDRMFAEVMKMLRLEDSETYRKLIKEGERNKSIEIAKKLLKEGMDIDKIAQITELPKEEIKKLLN